MPAHLLLPLFSSVVFVLGMLLVKRGTALGTSPWTGTLLSNLWLAALWGLPAIVRQQTVPVQAWGQAAIIGGLFVLGQLFTYLAFQFGDVSVATPIFGIKVLMVAAMGTLLAGTPVTPQVWLAAALATAGVILVQTTSRPPVPLTAAQPDRRHLTVVLALLAALALSVFDVLLQRWGPGWNSHEFLPVAFGFTGLLSLVFVPWADAPRRLVQIRALGWVLAGTLLMAVQAVSMSYALATYGDATRVNIVYALRGLWGVLLAWSLARAFQSSEALLTPRTMLQRLCGALLLTLSVVCALWPA